jgi:tetratricopeptide (TPR) repeat protein/DNA-binding SARP family transcriptional activator
MELHVLGPVAIRTANKDHALGSVKERTLLAILALASGRALSTTALISRIWDDRPPPKARDSLGSYISRLRRRLHDAVGDAIQIAHGSGGYALLAPPEILDLDRFRGLVRQSRAIWESGDGDRAVKLLRQADELWHGEALAGLPGEWVGRVRHGLEEERRNSRHMRIDIEVDLGRHGDLIGELFDLTARYPLDEHLIAQLMIVLYRSDRQADALALYHRTRHALSEEQGTNPGRRLRDLYQRILVGDIDLAVNPRHRLPGTGTAPDTLPPDIDYFVGRQRELDELFSEPAANITTPVVITGMPGVGKTTLAIRAAHQIAGRLPDARLFLDLNGHNPTSKPLEPTAALAMLLRMLEIPAERIPHALPDRAVLWRREMASRRAVVLLDDAIDAKQLHPLLPRSPTCAVLVTSRNRLRELDGCHQLILDVMREDDASALFTQLSGIDVERHQEIVLSAVRHCGHLPLAVHVMARQFRDIDGQQLTALVDSLADQTRAGQDPQIADAFELSCRNMPAEKQEFLRHLGLHPCREITLLSAAALVGRPLRQLEPMLEDLVDRNLIHKTGSGSYRFHDLIRDYAHHWAISEDPRPRAIVARVLNYYLRFGYTADQILFPQRRRISLPPNPIRYESIPLTHDEADRWMRTEWRNALEVARYALASEWKERGAHLIHLLAEYLDVNGHWNEAIEHHELALRARRELGARDDIAQSLAALGFARLRTADHETALECATEALSIYRLQGDRAAQAEILDYIGGVYWWSGRNHEALAYHKEALDIYRSLNHNAGQALTLLHRGMAQFHLGRYDDALADLQASLDLCRQIGDQRGVARALNNLGDIQQHRGFHRDAIELYEASLEIFHEDLDSPDHPVLLNNIGKIRRYKGDYEEALSLHRQALRGFRATGDRKNVADALDCIGETYRLMDAHNEAIIHHEQAKKISEEISDSYGETRALRGIADALRGHGRYQEALDRYKQALTVARAIDDAYQEAMIHDGIGQLLTQTQRSRTARIHWHQALDLFERLGVMEAELVRIRLDTTDATTDELDDGVT